MALKVRMRLRRLNQRRNKKMRKKSKTRMKIKMWMARRVKNLLFQSVPTHLLQKIIKITQIKLLEDPLTPILLLMSKETL
jgi:hypothetical protein